MQNRNVHNEQRFPQNRRGEMCTNIALQNAKPKCALQAKLYTKHERRNVHKICLRNEKQKCPHITSEMCTTSKDFYKTGEEKCAQLRKTAAGDLPIVRGGRLTTTTSHH